MRLPPRITQALGGWAGLSAVTPTPVLSRYLLPFLLGTQILGILAGALGYVMTRLIWRDFRSRNVSW